MTIAGTQITGIPPKFIRDLVEHFFAEDWEVDLVASATDDQITRAIRQVKPMDQTHFWTALDPLLDTVLDALKAEVEEAQTDE